MPAEKGEVVGTGALQLGDAATDKKKDKLAINAHAADLMILH